MYLNRDVNADVRIQSKDGAAIKEIAIFKKNGHVGIGAINPTSRLTVAGNAGFLTCNHRFYINGDLSFDPLIAGIRNNNGNPSINSKDGGVLYLNRDVNADVRIQSKDGAAIKEIAVFKKNGHVGIGTINPTSRLTVAGKIESREVKVFVTAGADFVFNENYPLQDIDQLEAYIKENKHLPEIASAKEMEENGLEVGEFQIKLLQKIEELTLYIIEQEKRIKKLEAVNEQLMEEKQK